MAPTAVVVAHEHSKLDHLIDRSRPWWKNRRIVALNLWILLLLITSSTNGYDGSMMNGLQSLGQWQAAFNHPTGGKLGLLAAIQFTGSLCGQPFSPYIIDGFGRRPAIILGAFIMLAGVIVQTASQNVGMFIGSRFMIGFGLTFAQSASPMLITEIAYPTHRAPLTSTYNSLWNLGSVIAAWTTFGTFHIANSWSWRIPSALQGLPSVIQLLLLWFIPESPRWLISKGREVEALKILAYYHANGNETDPLVEYEMEEIKAAIRLEREVAASVGWFSLFKTPGNRRRMRIIIAIAFFSQWSGNGLTSYFLNKVFDAMGITSSTTQLVINGCLSIWSLILSVLAALYCDKLGRRPLFIASNAGMLVFWVLQTACFGVFSEHGTVAASRTYIAMLFLYSTFYALAYTPLLVSYTVEILPYAIRAKGITVLNFAVSLSLIFNQYVNPVALAAIGWKYYLVYVVILVFELGYVIVFIKETKNRTLEETAALFDGEDAVEQIARGAAIKAGVVESSASPVKEVLEEDEKEG